MHDVADIQIEDPIILILDSKDCLDVVLQLDVTRLTLLQRGLPLFLPLVNVVVS